MKKRTLLFTLLILAIAFITLFAIVILRFGNSDVGGTPTGKRLERILNSSNYDGKNFVNLEPTEVIAGGNYWEVLKSHLSSRENSEPQRIFPAAQPDITKFGRSTKFEAIWLGHSTVLLSIDKVIVLTDPVFENLVPVIIGNAKRFQPTVVRRDELPLIDVVIISHDHYDHLERSTIEYLSPRGTMFFVPLGIGAHLEKWGVPNSQIVELDWWENKRFKSVELVCTPARHFSGRTLLTVDQTLWASWAILGDRYSIYYGGDTGFTKQFEKIGKKYGPFDLILLPIGGYDDSWPDIHLNPPQAVAAHKALKGKCFVPVHWGTFDVALHPWDEPIEKLVSQMIEQEIDFVAPQLGEIVVLDSRFVSDYWWRKDN